MMLYLELEYHNYVQYYILPITKSVITLNRDKLPANEIRNCNNQR